MSRDYHVIIACFVPEEAKLLGTQTARSVITKNQPYFHTG